MTANRIYFRKAKVTRPKKVRITLHLKKTKRRKA